MEHPIDFLFKHASGDAWLKEMNLIQIADGNVCVDCDRLSQFWPMPNLGVADGSKKRCTSCQVLAEGSHEFLGVNSIKSSSNKKYDKETKKKVDAFRSEDPFLGMTGHGLDYRPLFDAEEQVCADCNKPSSLWKQPHRGLKIKIDGHKKDICTDCQKVYEPRIRLLDNPHVKGRGYPDTGKLRMMLGCAMLVTQDRVLLGLNHTVKDDNTVSGFYTRFSISPNCPYEIVPLTHGAFIASLVKNPPVPPFILIDEIRNSSDNLVRNLKITEDLSCTYLCSDIGVKQLNLISIGKFFDVARNIKKQSERVKLGEFFKKLITGKLSTDSKVAQKFFSANPIAEQMFNLLPENPWEALDMIYISGKL